jgi:mycothiol synthase
MTGSMRTGVVASPAAHEQPQIPGLVIRGAVQADWDAMARVMNAANRADGVDEVQSGAELAAEHATLDAFDMARDVLIAEVGGEVVGFAVGWRQRRDETLVGESWGSILPSFRRRSLGTALWRLTHDRLTAELAADPRPGPRELRAFALDVETGALALLRSLGYQPIRFGFEMRRFITGALPEHRLPAGLEMRPVTPDQHRAIFDADNEAFEDHWGNRPPTDGDFVARFEGPNADTSLWCVAWDGDQVAGVVMNTIFQEENAQLGIRRAWLDHVSVRRPWRGRGVARALCATALRILREHGMDEAWLGVDGANPTGALRLYEGLGFTVARRWQAYGRPVAEPAGPGWLPGSVPTG